MTLSGVSQRVKSEADVLGIKDLRRNSGETVTSWGLRGEAATLFLLAMDNLIDTKQSHDELDQEMQFWGLCVSWAALWWDCGRSRILKTQEYLGWGTSSDEAAKPQIEVCPSGKPWGSLVWSLAVF